MRWRSGEWVAGQPADDHLAGWQGLSPVPAPLHARRLVNEEYKVWKKNTPFLYGKRACSGGGPPRRRSPAGGSAVPGLAARAAWAAWAARGTHVWVLV